jgi:hypothetical protein
MTHAERAKSESARFDEICNDMTGLQDQIEGLKIMSQNPVNFTFDRDF